MKKKKKKREKEKQMKERKETVLWVCLPKTGQWCDRRETKIKLDHFKRKSVQNIVNYV